MAVVNAASAADFERLTAGLVRLGPAFVSSGLSRKAPQAVAHFWASWCEPCAQMDAVFAQLALSQPHVSFVRVEAEEVDQVSLKHSVPSVPYFLFFKAGAVVDRLEGADPPALSSKLAAHASGGAAPPPPPQQHINDRLAALVHCASVVLFMKGTPQEARCGFSRKVVDALLEAGCTDFAHFDILTDSAVREGLKAFSDWPTYPQLFVHGQLLGGCDIVLELAASGDLRKSLAAPSPAAPHAQPAVPVADDSSLTSRIQALLASQRIMLFMKGTPESPKCGFSRKVVEAIQKTGVQFGSFDILGDEQIRAGLKEYANWPTYPQLFVNGELLGGCDIVLELGESGELEASLAGSGGQ